MQEDLHRSVPAEEFSADSQRALAAVTFIQNLKNILFFGIIVYGLGFLVSGGGALSLVVGWLAIGFLLLFSLEPAVAAVMTPISLLGPLPGKPWMALQFGVSVIAALAYVALAAYLWSKLYGLDPLAYLGIWT